MLQKTNGVFLHQFKYSENSIIARIYTESSGLKSFIIKGARSKKSTIRINVLQPLALLNLVFFDNGKSNLLHLKELSLNNPGSSIPFNFYKSCIAIFICEVLLKCIKEEEANPPVFNFVHHTVELLDAKEEGISIFPLLFLIKLSQYLGFSIENRLHGNDFFLNAGTASDEVILFLQQLKPLSEEGAQPKLSKSGKREMLAFLIKYYELNLIKFGDIKSHKVLETIM